MNLKDAPNLKSYVIHLTSIDIYAFKIIENFLYLKYGKNDSVDAKSLSLHGEVFLIKEIPITDPGVKDIPRRVIKDFFEDDYIQKRVIEASSET